MYRDKQGQNPPIARPAAAMIREEEEEEVAPIDEYRALKEDPFTSVGFLESRDFLLRVAGLFAIVLLPGLVLTTNIYPPSAETGGLLINNIAAAFLYASSLSSLAIFAVVLRLTQLFDDVNKLLQRSTYYVEYDGTKGLDYGSGSAGAYSYTRAKSEKQQMKDKLLADTQTEPALSRLRAYLIGSVVATAVSAAVGSAVGGQPRVAEEEAEDDAPAAEDGVITYREKKKKCGAGCMPGLDN